MSSYVLLRAQKSFTELLMSSNELLMSSNELLSKSYEHKWAFNELFLALNEL